MAETNHKNGMELSDREKAKIMMQVKKSKQFLGLLGIAQKAGKVVAGTNLVTEAIRSASPSKYPYAVFLASDVSENTRKRVVNCCNYYEVQLHAVSVTAEMLGKAIGKEGTISAVGITDKGLSEALANAICG